jgi:hypothetical protein
VASLEGLFPSRAVTLARDGAYTLSASEAGADLIERTTTTGVAATFTFPVVPSTATWVVKNNCAGLAAGALTLLVAGHSTSIGADCTALVTWDGAQLLARVGRLSTTSAASSVPGQPIALPASWLTISIDSSTATRTITDGEAGAEFLDIHTAYAGLAYTAITFPAVKGHKWIVRCATGSASALRCKAAGGTLTVDVNPGYDGFLVVDDTAEMTQVLVKHGNIHAAAGTDPTTDLLNPSALGTGTANNTKFLRGDQTWQVPAGLAPGAHASTHASGGSDAVALAASQITSGALALARGGTNADLSASGGTTKVLAQDASHVVSARDLVAADIPSLPASQITTGQLATARETIGGCLLLCTAFTPAGTGADTGEVMVPYDPADGTTSITWNVRRIWLRVNVAGGAPVAVIEKSTAAGAFSASTVGTLTMGSGNSEVAVTASLGTVASGNKIRFNVSTLATATGWSIGVEIGN